MTPEEFKELEASKPHYKFNNRNTELSLTQLTSGFLRLLKRNGECVRIEELSSLEKDAVKRVMDTTKYNCLFAQKFEEQRRIKINPKVDKRKLKNIILFICAVLKSPLKHLLNSSTRKDLMAKLDAMIDNAKIEEKKSYKKGKTRKSLYAIVPRHEYFSRFFQAGFEFMDKFHVFFSKEPHVHREVYWFRKGNLSILIVDSFDRNRGFEIFFTYLIDEYMDSKNVVQWIPLDYKVHRRKYVNAYEKSVKGVLAMVDLLDQLLNASLSYSNNAAVCHDLIHNLFGLRLNHDDAPGALYDALYRNPTYKSSRYQDRRGFLVAVLKTLFSGHIIGINHKDSKFNIDIEYDVENEEMDPKRFYNQEFDYKWLPAVVEFEDKWNLLRKVIIYCNNFSKTKVDVPVEFEEMEFGFLKSRNKGLLQ